MTWLATSPHGPLRYTSWRCADCIAFGPAAPLGTDPDVARQQARVHVEDSGHAVTYFRGTSESLYPLATAAEGGGDG